MNINIKNKQTTLYADMNVFRYVAYGDVQILAPDEILWVYSYVHLNEIVRNGNKDALEGIKLLKAVEIADVLNHSFESVGNVVLRNYVDPYERYEEHLEAISGLGDHEDLMIEYLLRFFGADNFTELSLTLKKLRKEVNRLTSNLEGETRVDLLNRAEKVSKEMKESIDTHLKERRPIDKTRSEMGLTSEIRKKTENSESPIDELWKILEPSVRGLTKNQFFGFEPVPGVEGVQHTQHGAITGSHVVLNMLGFSPDTGLAKRKKIKNIISDGQHVGMASYCNGLISADKRLCNKANAVYKYLGSYTKALWFEYKKGLIIQLGFESVVNGM